VAGRKIPIWRLLRWDDTRIEKAYQRELATCFGIDPGMADLVAAANFDYARWGGSCCQATSRRTTTSRACAIAAASCETRARSPGWSESYGKGDGDGDLVPDDRDRCPSSPDLSANRRPGVSAAGTAAEGAVARRRRSGATGAESGHQSGVQRRSAAVLLHAAGDRTRSKRRGQLLCRRLESDRSARRLPVFYDIRIRSERSSFFTQSSGSAHFYFVFRAAENVDASPAAQFRQVFRIRKATVARWNDLVATAIEPSDREDRIVQVRMVNGNGLSRGWSEPKTFSINLATRLFPAF
jgi:hypothetical protein